MPADFFYRRKLKSTAFSSLPKVTVWEMAEPGFELRQDPQVRGHLAWPALTPRVPSRAAQPAYGLSQQRQRQRAARSRDLCGSVGILKRIEIAVCQNPALTY